MRRKFPREWLEKVKIITKAKENSPLYNIYPDDEKKFLPTAKKKKFKMLISTFFNSG